MMDDLRYILFKGGKKYGIRVQRDAASFGR